MVEDDVTVDHLMSTIAYGGEEKKWQQIEEEITYSICEDLFTDPKTIPCLHMFCKQCIESNKEMVTIVMSCTTSTRHNINYSHKFYDQSFSGNLQEATKTKRTFNGN